MESIMQSNKGPYLNDIKKNFTTRDSLGIEGVAASISADLCPIVNTVTPRAFYWPFMVWIYYDFFKYSGIKDRNISSFDQYLKRQDYFFVMATLLNKGSDRKNLVGITQAEADIKDKGPYPYNPNYFKSRYGGMQYYNAGCFTLQFITDEDDIGNRFSFPKLTQLGEEMALAFENVIEDTEYYKKYRITDKAVPRSVLEQYGKVINIGLNGFVRCKEILKHRLFEINPYLRDCSDYIVHLNKEHDITEFNTGICRGAFFDHISPHGKKIVVPDSLVSVADGWEIVVGRQYFTSGLEMIWKPMLEQIATPKTQNEWIADMISDSDFAWDIDRPLKDVIAECNYDFETREKMVYNAQKRINPHKSVENGLRIILSIYNWIMTKGEWGENEIYLTFGADNHSIPLTELVDAVEEHKERSVKEFLVFIMQDWLVEQHYVTAYEKMLYGRDGFYYEIVDEKYQNRGREFELFFQGNRMIQLAQVMKDLDMI